MDNRAYYGEYSLMHWIELILKGNIILPEYQRLFVWDEAKVRTLLATLKERQFVPPVTIGSFRDASGNMNLILDGQQRLTSILLAYLGLFPDKVAFKRKEIELANDNDDAEEDRPSLDNIMKWTFRELTTKGRTKSDILSKIVQGNYKTVDWDVDEDFFNTRFLGFSYLVPYDGSDAEQQKYYSTVFRNINIQGETLDPQESRASLYFLKKSMARFFNPEFSDEIKVRNTSNDTKLDFVRSLALLSQYHKDGRTNRIARGYKPKMEQYYEEYIYSVVGERASELFCDFATLIPSDNYAPRTERLKQAIDTLGIPKQFTSIIDADIYFFGLIYAIIYENKGIDISKAADLRTELNDKITAIKGDLSHTKAPAALKYLKERMNASIDIYKKYEL